MLEQGRSWGLRAEHTLPLAGGRFLRTGLELATGRLDYQGSGTLDQVPDSRAEARLLLGQDLALGARAVLAPYLGFGLRMTWNDLRGTTSTGARGYRREASLLYLPAGCALRLALGGGWVLAPAAEYAWLLQGRAVSRLGDAGSGLATAVNHPAGGHGCLLRLDLERGRWRFGPWLQSWTLGASERVPIGRGYAAQEPGNTTREAGLGFTWRF